MTDAILLLEGGAFRVLYTAGVTDVFMENDLWFDTAGVSGGALTGMNYVSRQHGRTRALNIGFRHDSSYVGAKAVKDEGGVIGFDYMFHDVLKDTWSYDMEAFFANPCKFTAVAACCETGLPVYFDRDECGPEIILDACQASSSLPLISRPVIIGNNTYMDGGLAEMIPLNWAIRQGYQKIIVVRTRDRSYRKPAESRKTLALYKARFGSNPVFLENLQTVSTRYNLLCDDLDRLEAEGKVFVIAPEIPVEVSRLEPDIEKLEKFYEEGRSETLARLDELKAYLAK